MDHLDKKIEEAAHCLLSSERILLATHEDPDADGLSAMLAVLFWLRDQGKEATAFVNGELPEYLKFLPGLDFLRRDIPEGEYDLLVGFDYADFRRLGLDKWVEERPGLAILTFDHHPEGRQSGEFKVIDPAASSTTVLVQRLLRHVGADITPSIATCILAGIVVDTGGFLHVNTNAESLEIAGLMMRAGANLTKIFRETFRKKDPSLMRLWGEALNRIHLDPQSGLALSRATAQDLARYGVGREAMVEFSGVLNTIAESRAAVFLSQDAEDPSHIKGSLRSEEYKGVDVSELAGAFGGGGHKLAAGFKIKDEWKAVIERLIREARRVIKEKGQWPVL